MNPDPLAKSCYRQVSSEGCKNSKVLNKILKTPLAPLEKRGMKKTPCHHGVMPPLLSEGNSSSSKEMDLM